MPFDALYGSSDVIAGGFDTANALCEAELTCYNDLPRRRETSSCSKLNKHINSQGSFYQIYASLPLYIVLISEKAARKAIVIRMTYITLKNINIEGHT